MAAKDPVRLSAEGNRRGGVADRRTGRKDRRANAVAGDGHSDDRLPRSVSEIREEMHDQRAVTIGTRDAAASPRKRALARQR